MFGSVGRVRFTSGTSDDDISSYPEYNVMAKEGCLQILVRNAQNLQNVERFGYSDPHVILDVEG